MKRWRRRERPIKDAREEANVFRLRAMVALALIGVGFGLLGLRFFQLQVIQHDEFTTRSEANRVRLRALAPNRGLIYDRNGRLLADNQPAYRLQLVPEQVEDMSATLNALSELVTLTDEDRKRFEELLAARPSFQSIPVRLRLDDDDTARFAVNRHRFTGVDIVPYETRVYPLGKDLAHVLGYVGRLGPRDLERVDATNYAATSHIGKTGIERFYESSLHGLVGFERVEINAQGRVLRVLESEPAEAGADLYLTIDARLQQAAREALGGRAGAIVAVDPTSGEVLAMVSAPSYDPNDFVNGISNTMYQALIRSPKRPLFNRALQGGYEPGSTVKPYVALAGLDLGVIAPDHTVTSRGFYKLPGQAREYRDWRKGGHGTVDVTEAIAQSVNTYFYELAVDLGIDRMHTFLAQFGFGEPTGLDLLGETDGILPSRTWKRAVHGQPWYPGETVIAGIGQGFMVTTPLQLARAVTVLATRGEAHRLHLLQAAVDPRTETRSIVETIPERVGLTDFAHWELVIDGMEKVMHGTRGTARAAMAEATFRMAGKTGTAQVYGRKDDDEDEDERDDDEIPEHLRNHALFVGFAPIEAPRIAVAVVVEHGGSGSTVAAPVGRAVVDAYLDLLTPIGDVLAGGETP
ncbi:MAG: penicillin-binding protein 2 [Pseudomonadota bacterium]